MKKINKLSLSALFMSLTCLCTMYLRIPLPICGYCHLGNTILFLSAWFLGPKYGGLSASIGSGFADFFLGYPQYIIPTLMIKYLMSLCAFYGGKKIFQTKKRAQRLLGGIYATAVLTIGYFICDWIIFGNAAFLNLVSYIAEGIIGLFIAILIEKILERKKLIH